MAIFQDDKVKICQTQTLKEWFGGARLIIFTHEFALMNPDLKFI